MSVVTLKKRLQFIHPRLESLHISLTPDRQSAESQKMLSFSLAVRVVSKTNDPIEDRPLTHERFIAWRYFIRRKYRFKSLRTYIGQVCQSCNKIQRSDGKNLAFIFLELLKFNTSLTD